MWKGRFLSPALIDHSPRKTFENLERRLFTRQKSGTSQPKAEQCKQEEKSAPLGIIGGGSASPRWVGWRLH
jgi:hypothetical protein